MVDRTARLDTPARWDAALDRALANHIQVWQDQESGDFLALSSDATKLYTVRWYDCTCAAAEAGDPVCVHRAAFRQHCREEDQQVERVLRATVRETVAGPAAPRRMCTSCLDTGMARMSRSGRLDDYVSAPCGCGAGQATRHAA